MRDLHVDKAPPELGAALAALAAATRGCGAGPAVEERLVTAFRSRHRDSAAPRSALLRRAWIPGAAAAVLLLSLGAWRLPRVSAPPAPGPPKVAIMPAALPAPSPASSRVRKPQRPQVARRAAPVLRREPEPEEGVFMPLPEAARLSPAESLDVVRVQLPRSTMMRFGLPVSAELAWEPVNADVVFGQDGMARAIRFVK